MIYIATVHWKDPRWIGIQYDRLRNFVDSAYQIYAYINGIDEKYVAGIDVVLSADDPPHHVKLDRLAERIVKDSTSDDDWMIFLDGDAFPVAPIVPAIKEYFQTAPLAAIQRLENLGEKHTHPSFTVTTVGFWKKLGAGWGRGYKWMNDLGRPDTDVGANVYGKLEEAGISWLPLHRSNTTDLHPVFYGIYDDLIYHHGAGFRQWECRRTFYDAGVYQLRERWDVKLINSVVPGRFLRKLKRSALHPEGRLKRRVTRSTQHLDAEVYDRIINEPGFPESLIGKPEGQHATR